MLPVRQRFPPIWRVDEAAGSDPPVGVDTRARTPRPTCRIEFGLFGDGAFRRERHSRRPPRRPPAAAIGMKREGRASARSAEGSRPFGRYCLFKAGAVSRMSELASKE